MERTETSFWAVWATGIDWPEQYADQKSARDAAHRKARANPGAVVHVMKLVSQGSVKYSNEPELATGVAA